MLVIIPMSGFGERFRSQGYNLPKPLIEIEGKTFVQHVYELFSPDDEYVFICNEDHLINEKYKMEEKIKSFCPKARIVGIKSHKHGPIHAVNQVLNDYDEIREVIINYCDFTCYWDYEDFLQKIRSCNAIGALPAYNGFHPHSDGKTNYAYIKESNLWASDIQEKKPFTSNKVAEYASSGTYYFKSVEVLKNAIDYVLEKNINTNGEYYVSMCYKYLFEKNYEVMVYPLEHFMQWGTPQDFEEYSLQSKIFRRLIEPRKEIFLESELIIPMAGLGQRFKEEGYQQIKPLISVNGSPMVLQALKSLPNFNGYHFVLNKGLQDKIELKNDIESTFQNSQFIELDKPTNGQATTIYHGLANIDSTSKISIISCDNGYVIDEREIVKINNQDYDILVWSAADYPYAKINPNSYGWVYHEDENIIDVSVKKLKASELNKAVITGGFTFKNKSLFMKCYSELVRKNNLVRGEFYADSLIKEGLELGMRCKVLNVECYISWGTPKELNTFNYWKSCFNKWHSHPYNFENDQLAQK